MKKKMDCFGFTPKKEGDIIYSLDFAKHVVLATGIMDVQPKIGEKIEAFFPFANRGDLIYCVRCDGHKTFGKSLSILGNKDSAIYIGKLMAERYHHDQIAILTTGLPTQFSQKALDLVQKYHIEIYESPIESILGDPKVSLEGFLLEDGTRVPTQMSIVALGIIPYNQLLVDLGGKVDSEGRAIVDQKYQSNIENFFVVGDLVSGKKMQIYTVWDQAVDAADEINRRVRAAKATHSNE
ncbi:MAG: FAD-dependent oxidoreductase [Bdellovibrionota bacterium]